MSCHSVPRNQLNGNALSEISRNGRAGLSVPHTIIMARNTCLTAERISEEGEAWSIRFDWGMSEISFGEVIELAGILPLPPYMKREAVEDDMKRYQTVYSSIKGSVAAPTAGLHFTDRTLEKLTETGINLLRINASCGCRNFQAGENS